VLAGFEALGKNIFHLGDIGAGQAYKLVNNMTGRHIGTAIQEYLIEGLNFGLKAGLDLQKMIEVMSAGPYARNIQSLGLKPGMDSQKIIEIIRVPGTKPPGSEAHSRDELDDARRWRKTWGRICLYAGSLMNWTRQQRMIILCSYEAICA
jgi:hypothetical protein